MKDDDLHRIFSEYGKVKKAWLQKYRSNSGTFCPLQSHRGFGFIVFDEVSSVDVLLGQNFSRFMVMRDGRRIEVKRALSSSDMSNNAPWSAGSSSPEPSNEKGGPRWQDDGHPTQWSGQSSCERSPQRVPRDGAFERMDQQIIPGSCCACAGLSAPNILGMYAPRPSSMVHPGRTDITSVPHGGLAVLPVHGPFGSMIPAVQSLGLGRQSSMFEEGFNASEELCWSSGPLPGTAQIPDERRCDGMHVQHQFSWPGSPVECCGFGCGQHHVVPNMLQQHHLQHRGPLPVPLSAARKLGVAVSPEAMLRYERAAMSQDTQMQHQPVFQQTQQFAEFAAQVQMQENNREQAQAETAQHRRPSKSSKQAKQGKQSRPQQAKQAKGKQHQTPYKGQHSEQDFSPKHHTLQVVENALMQSTAGHCEESKAQQHVQHSRQQEQQGKRGPVTEQIDEQSQRQLQHNQAVESALWQAMPAHYEE